MKKILFIDRDGTLNEEPPDEQLDSLEKVRLVPGVIPALTRLSRAGYRFVLVSNQDGLGTQSFPEADFRISHDFVMGLLASQGIVFSDERICPHVPEDGCDCRKPRTGLVADLFLDGSVDRQRSFVVGDRETDLELAANLGIGGYRVSGPDGNGESWEAIASHILDLPRTGSVNRKTRETDIRVSLNLDDHGPARIATGWFFDHMLEQVAKHGGFRLELECSGDLEVDEHHTVEDTAIALGEALRQALGDKHGIGRYGFVLPMDEARAEVALDLSGRAYCVFDGEFERESVGAFPTELVPHFFRSLADSLGAAIHISLHGSNAHHMIESSFKGIGRALRQAIRREDDSLPSTKGLL